MLYAGYGRLKVKHLYIIIYSHYRELVLYAQVNHERQAADAACYWECPAGES